MRKLLAVGAALSLISGAGLALAQGAAVSVPADTIIAAQQALTTQACGACHRNYRAKLN